MKLEYLYCNNNNLRQILKALLIFWLIIIVLLALIGYIEKVNEFLILTLIVTTTICIVICILFLSIIIILTNNYKRKQFVNIKNNGHHFEGIIIMANYHFDRYGGNHRWLWNNSGDITVQVNDNANNKTYTIKGINYNNEFKLLKKKLNDNIDTYRQQYNNYHRKELKIDIYVLDNKVVADLDSIRTN